MSGGAPGGEHFVREVAPRVSKGTFGLKHLKPADMNG